MVSAREVVRYNNSKSKARKIASKKNSPKKIHQQGNKQAHVGGIIGQVFYSGSSESRSWSNERGRSVTIPCGKSEEPCLSELGIESRLTKCRFFGGSGFRSF